MGSQDSQRPNYLRLDGMNAEEQRLQTFRGWPVASVIDSARIAKAGFFRTGRGVEVECFACGGRISEWNFGDVAMARHRELNPNCPFVRNPIASSNIPIAIPPASSPVRQDEKLQGRSRNETLPIHNQGGPDYRKEEVRLASFCRRDGKRWPKADKVAPLSFAKAGFYWNPSNVHGIDEQVSDRVTCAFCEYSLGGWESGDDPMSEHRRCSNTCPFIMGAPVGNVPIPRSPCVEEATVEEGENNPSHPRCARDQAIGGNQFGNEKLVELVSSNNRSSMSGEQGADTLGVRPHRGPVNVRYSTTEARLASFSVSDERSNLGAFRNRATTGWPASRVKQSPQALADAGFFYTGQSDRVRCFHCDGGLWDWREDDDPWVEHAKWFPKCAYVMLVKGEDFVAAAKTLRPPDDASGNTISPSTSGTRILPSELQETVLASGVVVYTHQPPPRVKLRNVTSEELDELMQSDGVRMALGIGLDAGRIRNVLQRKVEETGVPFSSADALVLEVLGSQAEEREDSDDESDSEDEVGRIFQRLPVEGNFLRSYDDPEYQSDSDSDSQQENDADVGELNEEDNAEAGRLNAEIIANIFRDLGGPFGEARQINLSSTAISENEPSGAEHGPAEQNTSMSNMSSTSGNVTAGDKKEDGNESSETGLSGNVVDHSSDASVEVKGSGVGESKSQSRSEGASEESGGNITHSASASSLAALEEENRRYRESRSCKVCLDEEVGVVFLPCGHLVSCVHCAPSLQDCPVCRRPIRATVRTYLS